MQSCSAFDLKTTTYVKHIQDLWTVAKWPKPPIHLSLFRSTRRHRAEVSFPRVMTSVACQLIPAPVSLGPAFWLPGRCIWECLLSQKQAASVGAGARIGETLYDCHLERLVSVHMICRIKEE